MIQLTPSDTISSEGNLIGDFCISSQTRVQLAQFADIPATARGACQLEFFFPAGYSVAGAGSHQVDVWKTDKPISTTDTWGTAPNPTTLFGTVTLNSDSSNSKTIIINSGDCASMKDFKFTIANNRNGVGGTVNFAQQNPSATIFAGMRITHSC